MTNLTFRDMEAFYEEFLPLWKNGEPVEQLTDSKGDKWKVILFFVGDVSTYGMDRDNRCDIRSKYTDFRSFYTTWSICYEEGDKEITDEDVVFIFKKSEQPTLLKYIPLGRTIQTESFALKVL